MAFSIGFFGKLPAHGDFVQRNLPTGAFALLDDWLQQGLGALQTQCADQWLDQYLTAPIWKFALGAGLIGEATRVGAIMPSVDRVGRYFPLIVLATPAKADFGPDIGPIRAATLCDGLLDQLAQEMLRTLDDPCPDADDFAGRIGACALEFSPMIATLPEPLPRQWRAPAEGDPLLTLTPADTHFAACFANVPDALGAALFGHCSLWWTQGSELIPAQMRIASGLPRNGDFVHLYSAKDNEHP